MATVPLHPALVHVPLALAVLVPLAAAVAFWLMTKRGVGRGAWAAVVAAQAVLVMGAILALRTGGAEEERVERRVAEAPLERHEEAAQVFVFGAGAVLLVSALGLVGPARARRWTMLAATAGTFAVAALAVRTGKGGGELVYLHGAAGQGAPLAAGDEHADHDDDGGGR